MLDYFRMAYRKVKLCIVIQCNWHPLEIDEILTSCDGASNLAGADMIERSKNYRVLETHSMGLGIMTSFMTYVNVVIYALKWEFFFRIKKILFCSDSTSVVKVFKNE